MQPYILRGACARMNNPEHLNQALIPPEFALQSKAGIDAVEHVPAYSGALQQVPYNQHLGPSPAVITGLVTIRG